MSTTLRRRRARRQRQQREGVVLLVVVLLLVMMMGTAVYALRATTGEQRSSGEYSDAMWSRSIAEGMTMAAMAWEEHYGRDRALGGANDLDQRWRGGNTALFTVRYGVPLAQPGATGGLPARGPEARSLDGVIDAPRFKSVDFPAGVAGFVVPRDGLAPFAAPARSARTMDYRSIVTAWAPGMERDDVASRKRLVVTGFGETLARAVNGVPLDPSEGLRSDGSAAETGTGQRGLHTSIGIVRGYLDTMPGPL